MAGVAVIMISSQFEKLTGVPSDAERLGPQVMELLRNLDVHGPTLVLGLTTLVVMLVGSWRFPRALMALIGMLGAAAAVALLDLAAEGVTVIGDVPSALPVPSLPGVSLDGIVALLPAAVGVAFVGYTDNVLTGRAFAERRHERIDPKRELPALGAANVGAGLMQGFPVSSSGKLTAISDAVGGRSRMSGVFTALATVLAVSLAGRVLAAFPTAALGAVVVYAAVRLVDVPEFRRLARFRRSEFVIAVATTAAVLVVGVLQGVLVAVGISILDLLRRVGTAARRGRGLRPDMAGMHDVDDYPEANVVPGLIVYRYDSRSSSPTPRTSAAGPRGGQGVTHPGGVVRAQHRGDRRDRHHRPRRPRGARGELTDQGIVFALARLKQDLCDATAGRPARSGSARTTFLDAAHGRRGLPPVVRRRRTPDPGVGPRRGHRWAGRSGARLGSPSPALGDPVPVVGLVRGQQWAQPARCGSASTMSAFTSRVSGTAISAPMAPSVKAQNTSESIVTVPERPTTLPTILGWIMDWITMLMTT